MKKELIYFIYVVTILSFIIFIGSYYFSDENKKQSYRATKLYDNKIFKYNKKLIILKSDTDNIIKYAKTDLNNNNKYKFWELKSNDK